MEMIIMKESPDKIILRLEDEINQLREENKTLLQQIEKETFKDKIREALSFIDIISIISSTEEEEISLKNFLVLASLIVDAEATSILLYDKKDNMLYFEEAIGEKSSEVKKFRVKPNEGIAGYCFSTGESLAVSDVMKDPRFKKEIAQQIKMEQKALLAAPLIYRQEIVGVMEAVNKRGGGTFSGQDVEIFSMLANYAATFVQKNNTKHELYALFLTILKNAVTEKEISQLSISDLARLTKDLKADLVPPEEHARAMELASLVEKVSAIGSLEFDLVRSVLTRFMQYLRDQGHYNFRSMSGWSQ
jgi:GAF domain-containing protein